VASSHWEIVVTRLAGQTTVTLRGPETRAREVHCPADGEWFAIRFKSGAFMPQLPVASLLDGRDINLPQDGKHFWLHGTRWELPGFENAEVFVTRLAKAGVVARDPAVAAVLQGDHHAMSLRSTQRHFQQATGMSWSTLRQIERARRAASLLKSGVCISDTVHESGYFDQAHLTRSLKGLVGLTPASIARGERQLSFLYNTAPC